MRISWDPLVMTPPEKFRLLFSMASLTSCDGDVVVSQHLRLEKNLELLDEASQVDDEGDTIDTLQAISDRPIGDGSELHGIGSVPHHGELEDLSHSRGHRPQNRSVVPSGRRPAMSSSLLETICRAR